jgi:hypothetical protein
MQTKGAEIPKARYVDGIPTNLPAAAYDALEWLAWIDRKGIARGENAGRLQEALRVLREQLDPCLPGVYEKTEAGE